jgi:hypothetical protein
MYINAKTKEVDPKRLETALGYLKTILSKSSDLINIFYLDSDEYSNDIELTILKAFLNCEWREWVPSTSKANDNILFLTARRQERFENLKLALKWNRSDIAKTEIFTGDESFNPVQLQSLMELAIIENKSDFVDILLENRVNLSTFLTNRRLLYMYNADKVRFLIFDLRHCSDRLNDFFSRLKAWQKSHHYFSL